MKYYIDKIIQSDFDSIVERIKKELPKHGFGVVTEFNIDEKLKDKLGVDFRRYKILGACNPKYAYEALKAEPLIGTMLPCNIIVQELGPGQVQIAAIDPVASMMAVENSQLVGPAAEIRNLLTEIVKQI